MSEAASTQQRRARLGQLINLVSDIGLGSPADRSHDILGRVYEYFLSRFAGAEGKKAASSTHRATSTVLVGMEASPCSIK